MSPAAAAILEGMPDPRDLRRGEHDGMTLSTNYPIEACYPARNEDPRSCRNATRCRRMVMRGQDAGATHSFAARLVSRCCGA